MWLPCAPGVTPASFGLGLRHGILGACPGQYASLNRPYCESGRHSFASSDGDDSLTLRIGGRGQYLSSRNVRLFPDAARRPFVKVSPSTETVSPSGAVSAACPGRLCPATPVKQRVDMFHESAQFPQMRQATGDRRSRWRSDGVSWRLTNKQRSANTSRIFSCMLTFACNRRAAFSWTTVGRASTWAWPWPSACTLRPRH